MRFHLATIGDAAWNRDALRYWIDLLGQDAVGRHVGTADPGEADRIVFVDLQQHPDDVFLRTLRRHPLARAHAGKVLVYDERDRPVRTFPGVYVSAHRGVGRAVAGGPYPRLHTVASAGGMEPDLLWSFAGARTHPVRDRVLALTDPEGLVRDTTGVSVFSTAVDDTARQAAQADYRQLLGRSRFVLCPRGHGSSSFRLFETLAAGRVPVVISDRWLPPPRVDWSSCSLRVAEQHVDAVPDVLRERLSDWESLAAQARAVYAEHFREDRLWDHIAESLSALPTSARPASWWRQPAGLRLAAAAARRTFSAAG